MAPTSPTRDDDVALSRTMSHALRHEPGSYGLTLDADGWVSVRDLVAALRTTQRWPALTPGDVERVVPSASEQPHQLDGSMICAGYGRSVPDRVGYAAATPPSVPAPRDHHRRSHDDPRRGAGADAASGRPPVG